MDRRSRTRKHDTVDETLDQSFPASDPPAWTMGRDRRPPGRSPAPRQRARPARGLKAPAMARPLRIRHRPRGLRLLSPSAWLRWMFHPTESPRRR